MNTFNINAFRHEPVVLLEHIDLAVEKYHKHHLYCEIKKETLASILRYSKFHIETDSFLKAVLENHLSNTLSRADEKNYRSLREIVTFIYNEIPSIAWGSEATVNYWLKRKRNEG